MPGMDMAPKAPSWSPEHAAMGHCTPEAGAPDKKAPDMAPIDHDMALPADPDCPPEHAKMGHCNPKDMPAAGREDMAGKSGTELPPGEATEQEIGSGSCRVRVCESVEISVVAGILKKKNKKNKK